ncbi:MAG: putative porin, partial [Burkholderiales bacterium]
YGLGANAWIRARWLSANEIDGPPLSIDVLQVDLNAKF